jgi:pimeloyl-ACP methyl ester carboxylesterase
MTEPTHRTFLLNEGVRIHAVEVGEGPLVVLLHGFPESWRSWRHQLPALADAGYRVLALDVRGYGRSSRPAPVEAYALRALVGDVVGVIRAAGEERATVIGHDWGAAIAWHTALLHPEVCDGVAGLSVPYTPPPKHRPTETFARFAGEGQDFYMQVFQEPGRVEAEIEPDVRGWLAGIYRAWGPERHALERIAFVPHGARIRDAFDATEGSGTPPWMAEEDFDAHVAGFEATGLTGGLNRYRAMDHDWEDLAEHRGAPVTVPALFVGGALDVSVQIAAKQIERFETTLPALWRSVILDDAGHWIAEERGEHAGDRP